MRRVIFLKRQVKRAISAAFGALFPAVTFCSRICSIFVAFHLMKMRHVNGRLRSVLLKKPKGPIGRPR
jgi:cellobiose-specific phosphotransferase system component IIC